MPSRVILLMVLLTFIVITFSASNYRLTDQINGLIKKLAASPPAAPELTRDFQRLFNRPATPSGSRGPRPDAIQAAHAAPLAPTVPAPIPRSASRPHPWARYAPTRG